eukprot:GHVQ01022336.1.p2 GENE.GHVQ01022336.1~~GHVQ01022336.1.p2  ORF type:complete len:102 (+),score=16.98 GHVQ01022336.1:256-561(+)
MAACSQVPRRTVFPKMSLVLSLAFPSAKVTTSTTEPTMPEDEERVQRTDKLVLYIHRQIYMCVFDTSIHAHTHTSTSSTDIHTQHRLLLLPTHSPKFTHCY